MMDWRAPTLAGVLEARRRLGTEVLVKHENHNPTGAFKVRGGVNLVSQLSSEEREGGVIAASTGTTASRSPATRLFGVPATICVPEAANPVKVASMRRLGAELIFHGRDYDEAREHCEMLARERGYRYVHSGNEAAADRGRRD
jgi:threonine dehydratase